jgi:hypothetical protein
MLEIKKQLEQKDCFDQLLIRAKEAEPVAK